MLSSTLLIACFYGLTYVFYKLLRSVPKAEFLPENLPLISVIVPARNEEGKVGRCLKSLLVQNYPNFEIVIIDDRSTDNTAEVIQSYVDSPLNAKNRIKFVHGKDAPEGWIGKCNALAHAVGHASGDWFIFTDADTYHHPNSIEDAVAFALNSKSDLVSFVPVQELGSFPEKLIMPVLLSSFLLGDPLHSINDSASKRAYAYGQYIVCWRSSYLATGGHQSVRNEIVEDHALARVFKENGYKISVADGKTLYRVRMYTDLESLWQGWTKNLYSFIDSRIINLLIILALINTVAFGPFIQLILVAQLALCGDAQGIMNAYKLLPILAVEFGILFLWFSKASQHHAGIDWRNFFLMPFGSLAVSALFFHAAYLVLTGSQINWKGRRYVVNTTKTINAQPEPVLSPILESYPAMDNYLDVASIPADAREIGTIG
jgi:chlorobactene glucosyltransferase